jgi:signal transduction histidine kinase
MAFVKLLRTTAFKLSLVYLLAFALVAGAMMVWAGWRAKQVFDEQIASTIEVEITGLAEQYSQSGIRGLVESVERRARQPGASLYLVTTFAGETVVGNVAALPPGVIQRPGVVETGYQRIGEFEPRRRALARIFILPGGFRLLVGRDLEDREALRRIMTSALTTTLIWLTLIGTIGGILVARRVLMRVDAMNEAVQKIMQGDFLGRLPLNGSQDELDRLAENLNAMLSRIETLMTELKQVSDNIAHDLKTPLTRLRNRAEEALRRERTGEEYRSALEIMIEDSDNLIKIFNALLMIARLEAGQDQTQNSTFDLCDVTQDMIELFEPLAEDVHAKFVLEQEPDLHIKGNRELIGQAIANLLDNALKYGLPDRKVSEHSSDQINESSVIHIKLCRDKDKIKLAICDSGLGIAAENRERVLSRFVRLEMSRTRPGSGLGLSLVSAVVKLHGGKISLEDNVPGLCVVVTLPALADSARSGE